MGLVKVHGFSHPGGWGLNAHKQGRAYCEQLEAGEILFFPGVPFELTDADRAALLAKKQSGLRYHKNISYRPKTGELRGFSSPAADDVRELTRIMKQYSSEVVRFVERFLVPYRNHYTLDYASYRPLEEAGRDLSLHKRNDLLHVDAFPSRPTGGDRILRVFTNINPNRARSWIVSEGFDRLAAHYAQQAGLERVMQGHQSLPRTLWRGAGSIWRAFRGASSRTAYDAFMLHFHDWLKENELFQRNCPKTAIDFPPGSTWLVYTDFVPHAALTGQFALEQTFIIHLDGMVTPRQAPINILDDLRRQKVAA
jgi:hypothetical protein